MAKKETGGLVKTEPARVLSPFDEMERRFEEFFRRPFSLTGPSGFPPAFKKLELPEPSVDIFEDGDDIVVKAELPGMKKEDVSVRLTDNSVVISGEKKQEEKEEKKDYYRLERSYGSFTRAFTLPAEVAGEKAKAKLRDGVLEIRVPKSDQARAKEKQVTIE